MHNVTLRYTDGVEHRVPVQDGQTLLDAAEAAGAPIVSDCESGICGTCVGLCSQGQIDAGCVEGLSELDRQAGRILTCQALANSDAVVDLAYPAQNNAAKMLIGDARVVAVEQVSSTTAILRLDASGLADRLDFEPGQFAQIEVPGSGQWRSYSYANAPGDAAQLEFVVRLLPDGLMSNYLRDRAQVGDTLRARCSKGSFRLRAVTRPVVMIAGGTGLSAMLSMIRSLSQGACKQPVHLLYGVTHQEDLVCLDELQTLAAEHDWFTVKAIVAQGGETWNGPVGVATDLLADIDLRAGDVDVYLCGPAAMVQAARERFEQHDLCQATVYFEKFLPSGAARRVAPAEPLDLSSLDLPKLRREGKGTAVVVGGSVAGIAVSRALSDHFERVIVLEKDAQHHPQEGRQGAAQGWHLHHILTAGQQALNQLFPGIIDDMVEGGAFRVDMAESYKLRLGGSWKKQCKSGVEIICAGRPLLEWCIRRRLNDFPNIEFHYDSHVSDLIHDPADEQVLGIAVDGPNGRQVLPANFVVDASGKSSRLPEFLEGHGFGKVELEEDLINCFYSSMKHEVPPERRWDKTVMEICFAYRPNEITYAAQYYIDQSRSVMLTSLIEYNCYAPPRNPDEFFEFAKRMQDTSVAENIRGLKPASQVSNFRHPRMQRYHYQKMRRFPKGLVVVGDAYSSTDPVTGLGMTVAFKQAVDLGQLLGKFSCDDRRMQRRYFKNMSKIADAAWFACREQNLRFNWVPDVDKKRPFYFSALTWYMDRVTELVHEDVDSYRRFLSVIHLVKSPATLMSPVMVSRALGKWLRTKLRGEKTMIEQNYEGKPIPDPVSAKHSPSTVSGLHAR